MSTLEERFASLEESTRSLSADVRSLVVALQAIKEIEARQREIATRTAATETKLSKAEVAAKEREKRTRKAVGMTGLAMAVLLPAVSILVYWSLISHVNDLLDQGRKDRLASCQTRNGGTQSNLDREQILARLEKDPAARKAHADSAEQLSHSLVDCMHLYGPNGTSR
jgi:hypothetical protein